MSWSCQQFFVGAQKKVQKFFLNGSLIHLLKKDPLARVCSLAKKMHVFPVLVQYYSKLDHKNNSGSLVHEFIRASIFICRCIGLLLSSKCSEQVLLVYFFQMPNRFGHVLLQEFPRASRKITEWLQIGQLARFWMFPLWSKEARCTKGTC